MREGTPSSTARLIARSILVASRDPGLARLVPAGEPEIIARILEATAGNRLFRLALRYFPRKPLLRAESLILPGIIAHYLVRKRKIESMVREAIASGTEEVVVIAAGYDTLCLRLREEFPQTRFIEVDHPATQTSKKTAYPGTSNFRYLACDLAQEALPAFPENDSRIIVIEGLTMYLHEREVAALFQSVAAIGRTLVFTFMEKSADGAIGFRNESPLIKIWLKWRGEPFHWGITKEDLPAFLMARGLRCVAVSDDPDLRREILEPLNLQHITLAKGECVCIAHRLSQ